MIGIRVMSCKGDTEIFHADEQLRCSAVYVIPLDHCRGQCICRRVVPHVVPARPLEGRRDIEPQWPAEPSSSWVFLGSAGILHVSAGW